MAKVSAVVHEVPDERLSTVAVLLVVEGQSWSRTVLLNRLTGEEIHSSVIHDEQNESEFVFGGGKGT